MALRNAYQWWSQGQQLEVNGQLALVSEASMVMSHTSSSMSLGSAALFVTMPRSPLASVAIFTMPPPPFIDIQLRRLSETDAGTNWATASISHMLFLLRLPLGRKLN